MRESWWPYIACVQFLHSWWERVATNEHMFEYSTRIQMGIYDPPHHISQSISPSSRSRYPPAQHEHNQEELQEENLSKSDFLPKSCSWAPFLATFGCTDTMTVAPYGMELDPITSIYRLPHIELFSPIRIRKDHFLWKISAQRGIYACMELVITPRRCTFFPGRSFLPILYVSRGKTVRIDVMLAQTAVNKTLFSSLKSYSRCQSESRRQSALWASSKTHQDPTQKKIFPRKNVRAARCCYVWSLSRSRVSPTLPANICRKNQRKRQGFYFTT